MFTKTKIIKQFFQSLHLLYTRWENIFIMLKVNQGIRFLPFLPLSFIASYILAQRLRPWWSTVNVVTFSIVIVMRLTFSEERSLTLLPSFRLPSSQDLGQKKDQIVSSKSRLLLIYEGPSDVLPRQWSFRRSRWNLWPLYSLFEYM